jgi:hypothetical protein
MRPIRKNKTSSTPKKHYRRRPGQAAAQSKLNDETQEKICGFIAGGLRLEDACRLSGVHRTTVWLWKDRGNAGEQRYKEFLDAVELAEVKSKALLLAEIRRDPDWKAKKWILINRFPKEFRDYITQEITGVDGSPMSLAPFVVNFTLPPPDSTEFTTIDHSGTKEIENAR